MFLGGSSMLRRVAILFILAAVVSTGFVFAGGSQESGGKKVAYIVADLENPFWKALADGFEDTAKKLGMDPKVFNSSGQPSTQMKNAQDCVTMRYDAVAISATDSSSANAPVLEFNGAKIPVWIAHISPDNPNAKYLSMVDAQNEGGCLDAGRYIAEQYKAKGMKGTAAVITISLARSNGRLRHKGFTAAMDEAGIKLGVVKEAVQYSRNEAYTFTQDLLTANKDISILWCNYDEAVLGAMQAIKDAGRQKDIILGGFDGSPESLQAVLDGGIQVMAIQPAYRHGAILAEQMYAHLVKGESVKSISTDCPLVTTQNAKESVPKVMAETFGPAK
jgi:ABC-type sugar transport system substrate-binding protein